jgi:hypothetical protein
MKSTPFQTKHTLEFGLEVVSKDAKGDVTVRCLFYIHEGRDGVEISNSLGRKHKATSTIKYFMKLFAPFNYHYHLKQHAKSWAAYQALSDQDKKEYFKNKVNRINILHQHMDLITHLIKFIILTNIVDTIISNIFFHNDKQLFNDNDSDNDTLTVEAIAKKAAKKSKEKVNTMKLFVK